MLPQIITFLVRVVRRHITFRPQLYDDHKEM